jgi:hypothetical protein
MCSLYAFLELPLIEQLRLIRQQGTFLATRSEQRDTINLYSVDLFFVEVYCGPAIYRVRPFVSTRELAVYLPAIDLKLA